MFPNVLILLVTAYQAFAADSSLCRAVEGHNNLRLFPEDMNCGWTARIGVRLEIHYPRFVDSGMVPWMALLIKHTSSGRKQFCDGVIINNKYIVTSAQCVQDISSPKDLTVRIGALDTDKKEYKLSPYMNETARVEDFNVDEIVPHELYDPKTSQNDIAIVRLQGQITFIFSRPAARDSSTDILPICLPLTCSMLTTIATGASDERLMGWEKFKKFKNYGELTKMKEGLKEEVLDPELDGQTNNHCNHLRRMEYEWPRNLKSSELCKTGFESKSSCPTDFPIFLFSTNKKHKRFLYGMASGQDFCDHGDTNKIARVSNFVPWILDHVRE